MEYRLKRFITKYMLIKELCFDDISNLILKIYFDNIKLFISSSRLEWSGYANRYAQKRYIQECLITTFRETLMSCIKKQYTIKNIFEYDQFPLSIIAKIVHDCLKNRNYKYDTIFNYIVITNV